MPAEPPSSFPPLAPLELLEAHVERLHQLMGRGFQLASFPLFPACVGVRRPFDSAQGKEDYAALLKPVPGGSFELLAPPTLVIDGNLSALTERGGEAVFVWKSRVVPATDERRAALQEFERQLREIIA